MKCSVRWGICAAVGLLVLAPSARAEVQLRLFVYDGNEALTVLHQVVRDFEKVHPSVRVKLESASFDVYFQKLLASYAAHTAPDVAMLDPQSFQRFAKRGALLPLNQLCQETPGFTLNDYYPEVLAAHRYHGELYCLPRDIAPMGLIFYNKRLFREAGLPLPDGTWTWSFSPNSGDGPQDFTFCMQQLTKIDDQGKVKQWGFAPTYTGAFAEMMAYTQGARLANGFEDFTRLTYSDPRVVKAYDFISDLSSKKHWMPSQNDLTSVVQSTAVDLFISQRVAMYLSGIWDVPRIRDVLKPGSKEFFAWDIALSPGYRDPLTGKVNRSQPISASGYSIIKSTPHLKESWELVRWMAGPPGLKAMAKAGIAQPAMRPLAQGEDWIPGPNTPLEQQYPANRIITDVAVARGVFQPTADYWTEVSNFVQAKTEIVCNGSTPAAKALREGDAEGNRRLDQILQQEHLPRFNWPIAVGFGSLLLLAVLGWVFGPEIGKKRSQLAKKEGRWGWLFVSPWILGTLLFSLGPMILSLLMSFTDWDIIRSARGRGFGNYQEALFGDDRFWNGLRVSSVYTAFAVPMGLVLALVLALLLNTKIRGMPFFRTCFYLPALASAVASSLIWRKILQPEGGLLNAMLFGPSGKWNLFGLRDLLGGTPNWLGEERLALPALTIMSLWGVGSSMVILLASLKNVPTYYYEAAELDGAGPLSQFRVITLPMISPALLFSTITGVIASFQEFTEAFVMTQGGPNNATRFYMLHLYDQSFGALRMGYASALAWILFLIVLVLSVFQLRLNKHVYYEAGEA